MKRKAQKIVSFSRNFDLIILISSVWKFWKNFFTADVCSNCVKGLNFYSHAQHLNCRTKRRKYSKKHAKCGRPWIWPCCDSFLELKMSRKRFTHHKWPKQEHPGIKKQPYNKFCQNVHRRNFWAEAMTQKGPNEAQDMMKKKISVASMHVHIQYMHHILFAKSENGWKEKRCATITLFVCSSRTVNVLNLYWILHTKAQSHHIFCYYEIR